MCEAKGQEELLEGYFGQQHFSSFSTNFRVREVGLDGRTNHGKPTHAQEYQ